MRTLLFTMAAATWTLAPGFTLWLFPFGLVNGLRTYQGRPPGARPTDLYDRVMRIAHDGAASPGAGPESEQDRAIGNRRSGGQGRQ